MRLVGPEDQERAGGEADGVPRRVRGEPRDIAVRIVGRDRAKRVGVGDLDELLARRDELLVRVAAVAFEARRVARMGLVGAGSRDDAVAVDCDRRAGGRRAVAAQPREGRGEAGAERFVAGGVGEGVEDLGARPGPEERGYPAGVRRPVRARKSAQSRSQSVWMKSKPRSANHPHEPSGSPVIARSSLRPPAMTSRKL